MKIERVFYRSGFALSLALICLITVSVRPAVGGGVNRRSREIEGSTAISVPTSHFSASFFRDAVSNRVFTILLAGGVMTWLGSEADDEEITFRVLDTNNLVLESGIDAGNAYGSGMTLGLITAGMLLSGKITNKPLLIDAGNDLTRSLLLSGVLVWSLKLGLNRRRPMGGNYSFPSGHTAAAFSVAPVLQHHFGWKTGIPAYTIAAFTAMGRMEDHKHYLSDVLFGAVIGFAMGDAVVHQDKAGSIIEHIRVDSRGVSFHNIF